MEDKEFFLKVKEQVDKSNNPVLVRDEVDYLKGYQKLKYYYSNELVKRKHINTMKQDKYCKYDNVSPEYDIVYTNPLSNSEDIKILVGYFYKEMNPFLND